MITQEEAEALEFEYQQLSAQKTDPAVKWTPGKQKRLERLEREVKKIPAQKAFLMEGITC